MSSTFRQMVMSGSGVREMKYNLTCEFGEDIVLADKMSDLALSTLQRSFAHSFVDVPNKSGIQRMLPGPLKLQCLHLQ